MEGIDAVESKITKKVNKTDGQSDWMKFKSENKNVHSSLESSNLPSFPKLGHATHAADRSHKMVGKIYDDRSAIASFREDEDDEDDLRKKKRNRDENEENEGEEGTMSSSTASRTVGGLGSHWIQLKDANKGTIYYFNPATGETSDEPPEGYIPPSQLGRHKGNNSRNHPSLDDEDGAAEDNETIDDDNTYDNKSRNEVRFIPSATYIGRKPGYIFTRGDTGQGYYLDVKNRPKGNKHQKQHQSQQRFEKKKKEEKTLLDVAMIALAKRKNEDISSKIFKGGNETFFTSSSSYDNENSGEHDLNEKSSPDDWKAVTNPLTRKTYFVNKKTGEKLDKKPF